jgi:hypothetical protein
VERRTVGIKKLEKLLSGNMSRREAANVRRRFRDV